ncbi:ATP-binding cassette domain-containing protein [Candidatus Peregrinibacteria bacterium]|nr:MAG: ATP-binding cassette domain-containing protein [Candidatus Peregrinibacteria bacterium]
MSTIRVRGLRKNYDGYEALKGLSFDVDRGEIVGFLGPNGAGKTTTMKILTCFMAATSGEVRVAGFDCFQNDIQVRQRVGYLPENNPLYPDMLVREYLVYMAELHRVPTLTIPDRVDVVMSDCGLSDRANHPIHTLSKGYKQRVGLAAALVHDPEILILDEPTVGLDPNQIVEIRQLIKTLGKEKTVLLSSHLLAEVELTCNRLIIINEGKIVASGTPAELKNLVEGHSNVKVTIRGDKQKIEDVLAALPGVKEVKARFAREKGANTFDLTTVKNRDLRDQIVKAVVENEFDLLEIYRDAVSLEELFNQVTK